VWRPKSDKSHAQYNWRSCLWSGLLYLQADPQLGPWSNQVNRSGWCSELKWRGQIRIFEKILLECKSDLWNQALQNIL
jgi:hypothetical protein